MIEFQDIGNDARRQYIDALATFNEQRAAMAELASVRGGMHWKSVHGAEYLIRTSGGSQKSLGRRSPVTEEMFGKFIGRKAAAETRLASLDQMLTRHARMNRALHVGRAPQIMVDILNRFQQAGIDDHFMVIGTHALYAYEAAAGVRILDAGALETRDVDLLWDIRKRISFLARMDVLETSMIGLLQRVDNTFRLSDTQKYTASNASGFEVDIIRREAIDGDPHPVRITEDENDFWVTQARRSGVLQSAPRFSSMVISPSGQMAMLETVHPLVFAEFKRWMAQQEDRNPLKKSRDLQQAEIIERLVEEYLPHLLPAASTHPRP